MMIEMKGKDRSRAVVDKRKCKSYKRVGKKAEEKVFFRQISCN